MSARMRAARFGLVDVFGRAADHLLSRLAGQRQRRRIDLQTLQAARVAQRDRQRRQIDDALQRGLRLRDARLGLAAPFDVEQRIGELAPAALRGR